MQKKKTKKIIKKKKKVVKKRKKRKKGTNASGQGRRSMGLAPFFSARLSLSQDAALNAEAKERNLPKVYVLREWIAELAVFRDLEHIRSGPDEF